MAMEIYAEWKRRNEAVEADLIDYNDDEAESACKSLFIDPPWWSRVWILQEVIHSSDVFVYVGAGASIPFDSMCSMYSHYQTWKRMRDLFASRVIREINGEVVIRPGTRTVAMEKLNELVTGVHDVMDRPNSIVDLRSRARTSTTLKGTPFSVPFAQLLFTFRFCGATNPLDKVYSLRAMAEPHSKGANVPVDYEFSKEELYLKLARPLMTKGLASLIWVEAPERLIGVNNGLPSWVPDYTTQQGAFPRIQLHRIMLFSADLAFPAVPLEPRFEKGKDPNILVVRGIYIGVVTQFSDERLTDLKAYAGRDTVRLMTYDVARETRHKIKPRAPCSQPGLIDKLYSIVTSTPTFIYQIFLHPFLPRTFYPLGHKLLANSVYIAMLYWAYLTYRTHALFTTSWAPCHTERGDIIIVAAGSRLPLILRPHEDGKYLFVGTCWLISGDLKTEDLTDTRVKGAGFSPMMFGSACKAARYGSVEVEQFEAC